MGNDVIADVDDENFIELENIEFNIKNAHIKAEIEEDTAMIAEINQHSLKIENRKANPKTLLNVRLQIPELNIIKSEENCVDVKEEDDTNTNVKVDYIGLEIEEFNIKDVLTRIKSENEKDTTMVTEVNQHSLNIDDKEIDHASLLTIDLQNEKLCIKDEDNCINIKEGDDNIMKEINSIGTSLDIETEDINTTYESFQEPSAEIKLGNEYRHYLDPVYKCDTCTYEATCRNNINIHTLTYKNHSAGNKMFKCDMCVFETKYRKSLERHRWMHKGPSRITKFKCEMCKYYAKCKESLNQHKLIHISEMHKCNICGYEAKYKCHLNKYKLVHKDPSEITMLKCRLCTFETKRKGSLKCHMIVHKNPSEAMLYKCESCTFKTKHKSSLKLHKQIHESRSEVIHK